MNENYFFNSLNQNEQDDFKIEEIDLEGKKLTYEEAYRALEIIVRKMEAGKLSLDDSVKAYTKGMELVKYCEDELKRYEDIIDNLGKNNE